MPRYAFGPFLLDTEARVLLRGESPAAIAGKPLDTLVFLVQNRGRLLDKDELLAHVWPGAIVEEANLSQSIFIIRKILGDSPKDHRYIATLPGRGYQFVAEVKEVENDPERDATPRPAPPLRAVRRWKLAAIVGAIALAAAVAGVLRLAPRRALRSPSQLLERRLTFNSSANDLLSSALSPDGKYLAYSDRFGIHVRLLSTGEERNLPEAGSLSGDASSYVDSWFPDGTELLAHTVGIAGQESMWAASIAGRASRHLRENASGWSVSPDGTRIAFSPTRAGSNAPEIWVMNNQGDDARRVLSLAADEFTWLVEWSPDGQRLAFIRAKPGRQSLETTDLKGEHRTTVLASPGPSHWVRSAYWLSDHRLIYSQAETDDVDANLWQMDVDPHSGAARSQPQRLTHWTGIDALGLSANRAGSMLVVQKVTYPAQIFIGDLAAGVGHAPHRLTDDEAHDWATAWTADSKSVLFSSDRSGKQGIYKQEIDQSIAEPLVEGRENVNLARLSPDGKWVLYAETLPAGPGFELRHRVMRIPLKGGIPETVVETTGLRWDDHQCSRAPANVCILIGPGEARLLTVTGFDPLSGSGKLLRTIPKAVSDRFSLALSPDGSTLALTRAGESDAHIRLLSLNGGPDRELHAKGWPNIESIEWSADGRGVYCGSSSPPGGTLVYLDLKGTAKPLWKSRDVGGGGFIAGVASPDGRHLALSGPGRNSNAWMLAGF